MIGRIPILDISPSVAGGEFPTKAVVGEEIDISATIFREGHDLIGANVVLVDAVGQAGPYTPMHEIWPGSDRWSASITPTSIGDWQFYLEAWHDPIASWLHAAKIKVPAGLDAELVLEEGARLFAEYLASSEGTDQKLLTSLVSTLRNGRLKPQERLNAALDSRLGEILYRSPLRRFVTKSQNLRIQVDRNRALVGAWYEFFPRSEGAEVRAGKKYKSGTFKTALTRLDAAADMGFDVVYLPPIHPIGRTHRKGPNNTLTPAPNDPGVPWAIGGRDGGHEAINPDLGSLKDFENFVAHAHSLGLEIALDLALQASPDHPWVIEHPEWFSIRANGSIAYAENPPKKYQDIYPFNFDNDYPGILAAVTEIVRLWMDRGVRIFRVDNPHTKPLHFWHDLLADIRATDPDVIFLAEAFTRPSMMHALGKIGFHQSYTYFTWRSTKHELEEYGREVSRYTADFFRPNFWVNTPDILPHHLQSGAREMFALRALLAATMVPAWGMYAGYELFEHEALEAGGEEYLDSEKYQFKPRDWQGAARRGETLAPFITQLNQIRRKHPALQRLRNLQFHASDSENVLVYSKHLGDDKLIVAANLAPTKVHESWIHLDFSLLGLNATQIEVEDLLDGSRYVWKPDAFVRFDPQVRFAHLMRVV